MLSWVESVDSARQRIAYSRLSATGWSDTRTVVQSDDLFTNWADAQRTISLDGDGVLATWGASAGASYMATHLMAGQAEEDDSGLWHSRVHTDTSATQHGFASLAHTDEGPMVVWLDGRETMLDEGITDESAWGEMTLYAAFVDTDGTIRDETLLDRRVCDCCPTATVKTGSGALIAYRNRTDDEKRDIHLIRYESGTFSEPTLLHDDGWVIHGCPVNGPALAADGERVAVAWFTAADDYPTVRVAFSSDGGRSFSAPVDVDSSRPKGRVGIVLHDDGSAAVSWIGIESGMSAIWVARVREGGIDSAITVAKPRSTAFTGIPVIERWGDDIVVFWRDGPDPDSTRIHAAQVMW